MIVGGVVDELGEEEDVGVALVGDPNRGAAAEGVTTGEEDTVGDDPATAGGGDSTFGFGWMTGACWDEGFVVVVGEFCTTASSVCCRCGVALLAGGLCGLDARPCDCEGEVGCCGCREGLRDRGNPIIEPVGELDRPWLPPFDSFTRLVELSTCSLVGSVAIIWSTLTKFSPQILYLLLIASSCAFSTWFSFVSSTTRCSSTMSLKRRFSRDRFAASLLRRRRSQ
uniref:Uncharacterized protein n=1 Tax=Anopheles farauti TaxID=69004 RepID=A0A182Q2Q3_9DIPT